jgi:hypothetical protein
MWDPSEENRSLNQALKSYMEEHKLETVDQTDLDYKKSWLLTIGLEEAFEKDHRGPRAWFKSTGVGNTSY